MYEKRVRGSTVVIAALAVMAIDGSLLASPPEAIEIGPDRVSELPRGKEADGIIGDFVIRNDRIEATVSGNLPLRKANMSTNYRAPTAGCLYDLAVRGSGNDQLTNLAPGNLEGLLSSVRVVEDGSGGAAAIAAERTAARGKGIHEVHLYRLEADWEHLLVHSTWTNRGKRPQKIDPRPAVKGLRLVTGVRGITFGDAMDPMDRQGYAHGAVEWEGASRDLRARELAPGESLGVAIAVAPGRSPAEAFGRIARLRGPTGTLRGSITEEEGGPVLSASATLTIAGKALPAYPHRDGRFEVHLPAGTYPVTVRDTGRPEIRREVNIEAGKVTALDVEMVPASRVHFIVTEGPAPGRKIPCKVQFIGINGTRDPSLGVGIRAHGCDHQYHSETGEFTVQVPPGDYRVIVTHGIEYSHYEWTLRVPHCEEVTLEAVLERVVDSSGWISTDFHNHSTPSGDNYCGTDDRIINLAAEQLEFAPATEHNRIYDWGPHIRKLGLERELATIVGIELTGPNAHFNSFPLGPTPYVQDNGAPTWVEDPRINAIVLRDFGKGGPDRWVHLNHPDVGKFFRDRDADGKVDGGYRGLEELIDAAEVWSTEILNFQPAIEYVASSGKITRRPNRTFAWLQLLNQGRRMWCVAVSDAHAVFGNGVGGWRTYVPSSEDRPERIDYREVIRNSKAGRMVVTNGPFLEARLDDGALPGGHTRATGTVKLHVRVQATTWIDIDRVQILVNGRALPSLNFTRESHAELFRPAAGALRFEATLPVPLTEDAHLIVVAIGEESNLHIGYGRSWQSGMHPVAYTNPLYVDVDGNGFRPNGDTLGHPLPVGGIR